MKNIGKYQGIPCYMCTEREYKDALNSGQDNGRQIFIIDETMVKRNEIIGYYDGRHVRDVYDGVPYVVVKQPGPQMPVEKEPEKVSVPTGETVGPVSLAIAINGEPVLSSTMIATPAAVDQYQNVYGSVYIDVANGCCMNISVQNISTIPVEVQNANLIVERRA